MEDKKESKTVRDARGAARRMARNGGGSYQKCLDVVAQDAGHQHWKAFMAAHPSEVVSDGPSQEAAPTRRVPPPFKPIPYAQWRGRLEVLTRNEFDEARVDRVARRADRIAERLGVPLWVVGCAPIAAIALGMTTAMFVTTPSLAALGNGLIGTLAAAMICFVVLIYGDSRMMSGMRTSTSDFLTAIQIALGLYLLVYVTGQLNGDARVAKMLAPYFSTPLRTVGGVAIAAALTHVVAVSYRWMMVVGSRYPSRAPVVPRPSRAA